MTSFHATIDSNPIVLAQDTSNLSLYVIFMEAFNNWSSS
jgi:hypothetical protein